MSETMTDLHALLACVVDQRRGTTSTVSFAELDRMRATGKISIKADDDTEAYYIVVQPPHSHTFQTYKTDDETFELKACTGCGHIDK